MKILARIRQDFFLDKTFFRINLPVIHIQTFPLYSETLFNGSKSAICLIVDKFMIVFELLM